MPNKILYVVNHSEFFLSHRLPFALEAQRKGFDVHVATSPSGIEKKMVKYNLTWHELSLNPGGKNPVQDVSLIYELYQLYFELKPDIIHHVTIKPVLYGGIAARLAGIHGVVNALSGLGYLFRSEDLTSRILRIPIKAMLKYSLNHSNSYFLLQNPDDVQLTKEMNIVDEKKIALIKGSGVNINKFVPSVGMSGDLPIVLLASRMLWDKGIGEFVKAADYINNKSQIARFVLAGKPDYNNPNSVTEDQLKLWDDNGVIEWWGYCDDMIKVLQNCSIISLPSYYGEGVPKVLIEAAACGKPIVTTDMPGCREIVRDGFNGYLVKEKNSKDLAKKILTLLQSEKDRIAMGKNGRNLVEENYSLKYTLERTFKLYSTLLKHSK